MTELQMIVIVQVGQGKDHRQVMDEMVFDLPHSPHFNDIVFTLDGQLLDDDGDPV